MVAVHRNAAAVSGVNFHALQADMIQCIKVRAQPRRDARRAPHSSAALSAMCRAPALLRIFVPNSCSFFANACTAASPPTPCLRRSHRRALRYPERDPRSPARARFRQQRHVQVQDNDVNISVRKDEDTGLDMFEIQVEMGAGHVTA